MTHYQINHFEKGVTLIESLVAMLVLSIGLLGTAHLMATGIKHSNGSYARTQATYYADTIAERMRANPLAVSSGFNYDDIDSSGITCGTTPSPYCARQGSTVAESCTAAELATFDAYYVSCGFDGSSGLTTELPGGKLTVDCFSPSTCNASSTYAINVSWSETEAQGTEDTVATKSVQYIIQP